MTCKKAIKNAVIFTAMLLIVSINSTPLISKAGNSVGVAVSVDGETTFTCVEDCPFTIHQTANVRNVILIVRPVMRVLVIVLNVTKDLWKLAILVMIVIYFKIV